MTFVTKLTRKVSANCAPLLFAVLMLAAGGADAAWNVFGPKMSGGAPDDGGLTDFAILPAAGGNTTISATAQFANQGVWRSEDGGSNWVQQLTGFDYKGTAIQPGNPQLVLAGRRTEVVTRTTDGGTTWVDTASGSSGAWVFGFSPSSPTTVYAGGLGTSGFFLASTGGAGGSWSSSAIGIDANPKLISIAVDPTDSATLYASVESDLGGFDAGLYKSDDGGSNWMHLSALADSQIQALTIDPNNNLRIYASSRADIFGTIMRSENGGTDWVEVHSRVSAGGVSGFTTVNSIAIDPDDSRIIYAVGGISASRVILSTDCGATWADVDPFDQIAPGGASEKVEIDSINDVVYVLSGLVLYRDDLETTATGECPTISAGGGGGAGGGAGAGAGVGVGVTQDDGDSDNAFAEFSGAGSLLSLLIWFGLMIFLKKRSDC